MIPHISGLFTQWQVHMVCFSETHPDSTLHVHSLIRVSSLDSPWGRAVEGSQGPAVASPDDGGSCDSPQNTTKVLPGRVRCSFFCLQLLQRQRWTLLWPPPSPCPTFQWVCLRWETGTAPQRCHENERWRRWDVDIKELMASELTRGSTSDGSNMSDLLVSFLFHISCINGDGASTCEESRNIWISCGLVICNRVWFMLSSSRKNARRACADVCSCTVDAPYWEVRASRVWLRFRTWF